MITRSLLLLLFLSLVGMARAQDACEGNFGANIFTEGDFGSGAANILPGNPGIAPGYTYTTNPPPGDGFYTITNSTAPWQLFPGWIAITDNSSSPNGYMMVVNADFSPGVFYEQEVTGLCGNTLYEFSADIINLIEASGVGYIKPNVSFFINNELRYTTGEVPQNEEWNTYGFTFTTGPDETEVRLSLRNNAPGGFGNDLALDNISFRPCGPEAFILPEEVANICEDGSPIPLQATVLGEQFDNPAVQWQFSTDNQNWEDLPGGNGLEIMHTQLSGGFYYYRFLLANSPANLANAKCRIISNVKTVYVQPKFFEFSDSICAGLSYDFGGQAFSQTGQYVDSLVSSIGCDSIVILNLQLVPDAGIQALITGLPTSCADGSDGQVRVEGIANAALPVQIALDGEAQAGPAANFAGLAPGTYEVAITDRFGCSFRDSISVASPPPLLLNLGPDLNVRLGETVILDPKPNQPLSGFEWTTPGPFDCDSPDCVRIAVQPTASGTYLFEGRLAGDCSAVDSVRIAVEKVRQLYIPNAFSPNDDGRNDVFQPYVVVPNVESVLLMQVYDRWGALVYERKDFLPASTADGWNGEVNGKPAPTGWYTYIIDVRFLDGEVERHSGGLQLVR
jgi:gliding motility-associated-like protein